MTEDCDRDVQDWFNRSVEELPHQPFKLAVLEQVRRRERHRQLQRYVAWLATIASGCLLLPELTGPLNMLAALPLVLSDAGGQYWPMLVVSAIGLGWWLVRQARKTGLVRGGSYWH